jgi:hypothetical protein
VSDSNRDDRTIDDLIDALEAAPVGNAELDRMVAFQLGLPLGESDQMIKLLLFEGYSWDIISELVQSGDPCFTTALDARIPGENVVLSMYSGKRGQWVAVHRSVGGTDFTAWAATEALARRAAALRSVRSASAFEARPASTLPAGVPPGAIGSTDAAAEGASPQSQAMGPASPPDGFDGPSPTGEWKILF